MIVGSVRTKKLIVRNLPFAIQHSALCHCSVSSAEVMALRLL